MFVLRVIAIYKGWYFVMQTVVDLPILLIFVKYIHKVIKGKYKKSMKKLFLLYIYYVSEACLKLKGLSTNYRLSIKNW